MIPLGCFYYKIRNSESEPMSVGGVFTIFNEKTPDPYFYQGICTYHFLLCQLKYKNPPYTVEEIITREKKEKEEEFAPIKRIVTLAEIS